MAIRPAPRASLPITPTVLFMNVFCPRVLMAMSMAMPAIFAAEPVSLQSVEKAAGAWVKTRAETVRLETEWSSDRVLLASTVNGLKERAQLLEEKREEWRAKTAEERAELQALAEKRDAAATEALRIETRLTAL